LDFIQQWAKRKTRRWRDTARLLGLKPKTDSEGFETIPGELSDRWRDKPAAEIDGDDIHAIVDLTREKGIPGLERHKKAPSEARARSMFATLSTMFSWLVRKRRVKQIPCVGIHRHILAQFDEAHFEQSPQIFGTDRRHLHPLAFDIAQCPAKTDHCIQLQAGPWRLIWICHFPFAFRPLIETPNRAATFKIDFGGRPKRAAIVSRVSDCFENAISSRCCFIE
jgi:hypothetical protein